MVVQYNFNDEVIEKYLERGKKLAFLVGHKDDRADDSLSAILWDILSAESLTR